MKKFFPILEWAKGYKKAYLSGDIFAGITVGVMLIPQGMAYAMIAGLPPVYGLYAALVPQLVYAVFGTSMQLAVGPVAMDSLLVGAGLLSFAETGSDSFILLAITVAFLMGVYQLLFGLFKLGFLVDFLSKPVISGFTSAAAIIIGLSQLKHLIGVDLERNNKIHYLLINLWEHLHEIHWLTLGIGVASIIVIKTLKKYAPKIPSALVVVFLGTVLVFGLGLQHNGVSIVGIIPSGFPAFQVPEISLDLLVDLSPLALTISIIAFMEAISVAKSIEEKHDYYKVRPSQELIALGLSNLIGSFFQSYPTTGGFSRTAVSNQAGAKTGLYALIAALIVALTLLFLTPLFYYLPKTVLASIIMVAVFGLIDFKLPQQLWKNHKDEFFLLLITFVVTLTVSIVAGIVTGIILSLLLLIYREVKPHYAQLSRIVGTDNYKNITRFDHVERANGVLVFRFDSQIFFANKDVFKEEVLALIDQAPTQRVVLNMQVVNYIDVSGVMMLKELMEILYKKKIEVKLANVIGPVRDKLQVYFSGEDFTTEQLIQTVHQAVTTPKPAI